MPKKAEKTVTVALTLPELNFIQKAVSESWLKAPDVISPKYYKVIFKKINKAREEF